MNTRKLLVSVLMLVSVFLSACAPAATPTVALPIVVPTTVAPAAVTLTTRPFHLFELPVSVSFDSEWSVLETYKDVLTLRGRDVDLAFIYVKYIKIAGPEASAEVPLSEVPFPDDFLPWIQSHGLFQVLETQPVDVGGFQGIQINTKGTTACGADRVWIFLRETDWRCKPGEDIRFILLDDVYGERVLIMTEGPASAEDFLLGGEAVQKVLDTVTFPKLTTFTSDKFELPMSISFGSEWHVVIDSADEILLVGGTHVYHGVELVFMFVKDAKIADPASSATMPWPDDFVAYLHSNEYLEVGESMPITVGGVNGVQIDVSIKGIGQRRDFIDLTGDSAWLYLDYDQNWRFIILDDVNGERLLISTTEAPKGFSVATELAQKVIDSVVFTK